MLIIWGVIFLSDKKINIIIILIVILSIVISYELMVHSPKRNETNGIEVKPVDKIVNFNHEVSDNISNNKGYFTVNLSNYELNDKFINMDVNIKKKNSNTYIIDSIVIDNYTVDVDFNNEIINFRIGVIKENKKNIFIYLVTNNGSQDGEGSVVVINNSGYVLYQNNSAYLDENSDEKYLIKEKYCDNLMTLSCSDSNLEDIAFRNKTYKSVNGQFVIMNMEEIKVEDVCYNE